MNDILEQIEKVHGDFSQIFIGGVPQLLNDDGAYLSFICVFAGVEALAGYCYPDEKQNGERFRRFICDYFEARYSEIAKQLWDLRNSMVHGFAPKHFKLCHHKSHRHFTDAPSVLKVLNAEDVYSAFVSATERYFTQLKSDPTIQGQFEKRLRDPDGGALQVGPL
jgi:hypothetical protein